MSVASPPPPGTHPWTGCGPERTLFAVLDENDAEKRVRAIELWAVLFSGDQRKLHMFFCMGSRDSAVNTTVRNIVSLFGVSRDHPALDAHAPSS